MRSMNNQDREHPTTPQVPQYRITLFYGPDPQEGDPPSQNCTFNVKKRSWKSGVQITVNILDEQLTRLRALMKFDSWLTQLLQTLPPEDVEDLSGRGQDLLVQILSSYKLNLAIEQGITQQNQSISGDAWVAELDSVVLESISQIQEQIVIELDIPV